MADVNDKISWKSFFPQTPDGTNPDYEYILRINNEGLADGQPGKAPTDAVRGDVNPDEILKFLAFNADDSVLAYDIDIDNLDPTALQATRKKIRDLQNRLRAYQAEQSQKLQALEARDDGAGITRTANRIAGVAKAEPNDPTRIMSQIEDFIIDNLMDPTNATHTLTIPGVGHFIFIPNLGLSLTRINGDVICPVPEDFNVTVDGKILQIGEIYPRLARVTGISPYSGGHIVPRNLTEQEASILTDLQETYDAADLISIVTLFSDSNVSFSCTDLGIAVGSLNTPYEGPTITVVTSSGMIFKIEKGQCGLIYLPNNGVIQIEDETPVYLPYIGGVIADNRRIEIPTPDHILDKQIYFDGNTHELKIRDTSSVAKPGTNVIPRIRMGDEIFSGMSHDDVQSQIRLRNSVHDYLQGETDRLAILGLKPSDLIGKTLSEIRNKVNEAYAVKISLATEPLQPQVQEAFEYLLTCIDRSINSSSLTSKLSIARATTIKIPYSKPTKKYNATEPTPETSAAPVASRSITGMMMGLWLMSASANQEAVANAVTLPQHSIELSAAATHEVDDSRDSHDSNARRIAERSTAIARSRLAARARAARAVIRG